MCVPELVPLFDVAPKPDPVGETVARLLERQIIALDAARERHGITSRRFPAPGTDDRRAVEKMIRERLTKDKPKRTEAECLHVLEVYAAEWLADPYPVGMGWTVSTPWRLKNFREKLAAEVGAVRSPAPKRAEAKRRFHDAC